MANSIQRVADQRGAISFAERVLELLDEGRYTATYKLRLPADARLWLRGKEFVTPDRAMIEAALTSG